MAASKKKINKNKIKPVSSKCKFYLIMESTITKMPTNQYEKQSNETESNISISSSLCKSNIKYWHTAYRKDAAASEEIRKEYVNIFER